MPECPSRSPLPLISTCFGNIPPCVTTHADNRGHVSSQLSTWPALLQRSAHARAVDAASLTDLQNQEPSLGTSAAQWMKYFLENSELGTVTIVQ